MYREEVPPPEPLRVAQVISEKALNGSPKDIQRCGLHDLALSPWPSDFCFFSPWLLTRLPLLTSC